MPNYTYDHIHIRSQDPMATAQWYEKMFSAKIIESTQPDGSPRVDLDINGLTVFIMRVATDAPAPGADTEVSLGLDHFGLRVENMDAAVAELTEKGAEFTMEPRKLRPGLIITYIVAPENVRIELLQRD
ncbi:MAG: VOC family protein [Dehalococcoidia bacterium]|jgi:catechol 2,3-dioxygenase-like lactoylglutathione lyase family enzyme|nr:VOC family protein [Dehalococcoidia bacterium]|tara:strand:+ start:500 stop:886 length:387 start_codon:yes stop_codon:yes gene_type:complete